MYTVNVRDYSFETSALSYSHEIVACLFYFICYNFDCITPSVLLSKEIFDYLRFLQLTGSCGKYNFRANF